MKLDKQEAEELQRRLDEVAAKFPGIGIFIGDTRRSAGQKLLELRIAGLMASQETILEKAEAEFHGSEKQVADLEEQLGTVTAVKDAYIRDNGQLRNRIHILEGLNNCLCQEKIIFLAFWVRIMSLIGIG